MDRLLIFLIIPTAHKFGPECFILLIVTKHILQMLFLLNNFLCELGLWLKEFLECPGGFGLGVYFGFEGTVSHPLALEILLDVLKLLLLHLALLMEVLAKVLVAFSELVQVFLSFGVMLVQQSVDGTVAGWGVFLQSAGSAGHAPVLAVPERVATTAGTRHWWELDDSHLLTDLLLGEVFLRHSNLTFMI